MERSCHDDAQFSGTLDFGTDFVRSLPRPITASALLQARDLTDEPQRTVSLQNARMRRNNQDREMKTDDAVHTMPDYCDYLHAACRLVHPLFACVH